jgi:hypothetical protein
MRYHLTLAERRHWYDVAPAAVLLIVSAIGVFIAGLSPSENQGQYAVMAPPWFSLAQTAGLVALAGGDIIEVGGLSSVIIAHSVNPTFVHSAYRAGAWLVIDPVRLRGCLGFDQNSKPMPGGL